MRMIGLFTRVARAFRHLPRPGVSKNTSRFDKKRLAEPGLASRARLSINDMGMNMNRDRIEATGSDSTAMPTNKRTSGASTSSTSSLSCRSPHHRKGMSMNKSSYKPSNETRHAVSIAKAEADYSVAKEKCDDKAGNAKEVCIKEAKAAEARAKADAKAKAQMQTSNANKPAKEKSTASTSKKESPGAYVDGAVITTKVKAAVLEEPSLKSAEINVNTYKGEVQLHGFVSSRASIDKAVEIARSVKGVRSVKNDMIVKGQQ